MGKRRFKKRQAQRSDYAQIQAAGKKRGLWGSLGATLLGGAAMLATGGAASPIIAGLMAGGGSFAGGHIGNWLAGKTKGGKLTGTKWYGSVGKELGSKIKDQIGARAMKTGLQATLMAGGGKIGSKLFSKGGTAGTGATATKDANALARFFKGGDKGGQTGFKGLIDYEGSAMGGFFDKMADARHLKKIASADELYGGDRTAVSKEISEGLTDFQFGDNAESFRSDPVSVGGETVSPLSEWQGPTEVSKSFDRSSMLKRQKTARLQGTADSTPFSGGGGTDFTQTSAWEGIGDSFPVTSPDFIHSDASRTLGASQYSASKSALFDTERHKRMQQSLGWHDRLFSNQ